MQIPTNAGGVIDKRIRPLFIVFLPTEPNHSLSCIAGSRLSATCIGGFDCALVPPPRRSDTALARTSRCVPFSNARVIALPARQRYSSCIETQVADTRRSLTSAHTRRGR
jgi:hypothetical protein